MRLARRNLVLGLLLVALLALDLATLPDHGPTREVGPLFPDLDPARVERIEVLEGDAPPLVVLRDRDAERPAGGASAADERAWRLPAAHGYPASVVQVEAQLVTPLCSVSTLDLVADDPARHGDYGVDGRGTVVRLLGREGELLAELVEGDRAPDGRAIYVRALSDPRVFRMPQGRRAPSTLEAYLDADLLTFELARVDRLVLRGPLLGGGPGESGELRFRRDPGRVASSWFALDGERERRVQGLVLDELVTTLGRLPVAAVLAGEAPRAEALLTVELQLAGGGVQSLVLYPDGGGGASTDVAPVVRTGRPHTLGVPAALHRRVQQGALAARSL